MKTTIQIWFPGERDRWQYTYEGGHPVPIPVVGERLMSMTLGGIPMVIANRYFHYRQDEVIVRLICEVPKPPIGS